MAQRGRGSLAVRTMVAVVLVAMFAITGSAHARSTPTDNSHGTLKFARTPVMGWSSWDFLRHDPTEVSVEDEAKAMVTSGLKSVGYRYVNLDDYWYECPGPQGPAVDQYGRWAVNAALFPPQGAINGIQATADYVHSLGLKFGIYITPGISEQAVTENTPIAGTPYTADEIATTKPENNYNCGGMVGIDYAKPGAQAFIDSWADELAHWGVDYVKLDGVGAFDIPDVIAWSKALRQTGRSIELDLSNSLNINYAATWARYANGWRTGGDLDCYCSKTSYPLTDWANVATRFDQVARWAPYGHPGTFNDYDSVEVGNGADDGLTPAERQTQLSLWALAASPLILGADLTHLNPLDRSYLLNRAVISVDQDAIDARRLYKSATKQVFAKVEPSGDAVVGLFNTGPSSTVLTTTTHALGVAPARGYLLDNLWSHRVTDSAGQISADVPSHGVALFRVVPTSRPAAPPHTTVAVSGPANIGGADAVTERVSFTNEAVQTIRTVHLSLGAPAGWHVSARSRASFSSIASGQTVSAQFRVAVPAATTPFTPATLTPAAVQAWSSARGTVKSPTAVTVTGHAVQGPFATYSSTTDPPARFSQVGSQFGIQGAGTGLYVGYDDYSAIFQHGVVQTSSTISTEVTGETGLSGYAKAGIMVRNDMTGAGTAPEGVVLLDSPTGGIQLQYDNNAGRYINAVDPPNGSVLVPGPVYLQLQRNGATYSGFYSTNGTSWTPVGSVTVPGQAATQDAGMFVSSQQPGVPGTATFSGFSVS